MGKKRTDSDEYYVLDICDEILRKTGSRQHSFHFLCGDRGTRLHVDIFYQDIKLVIEYRFQAIKKTAHSPEKTRRS